MAKETRLGRAERLLGRKRRQRIQGRSGLRHPPRKEWALTVLIFLSRAALSGPFFVDTLVVPCLIPTLPGGARVDTVYDLRNVEHPTLLDIGERTRLLVPVDQEIHLDRPLAACLGQAFSSPSADSPPLSLGIDRLDFTAQTRLFFLKCHRLHARVLFIEGRSRPVSAVVYDLGRGRWFRSEPIRTRYQALLAEFVRRLGSDLARFQGLAGPIHGEVAFDAPWMTLLGSGEWMVIPQGQCFDASLGFVYPEPNAFFSRSHGVIRYRTEARFESIAWAIHKDQGYWRIHPRWVIRFYSRLFVGINRWKDVGRARHGLEDIPILDYSLGVGPHFQPRFGRSLVFGIGAGLNATAAHPFGLRLTPAAYVQGGFQL